MEWGWDAVLAQLAVLRGLDRQRQSFGADWHEYSFAPPLDEAALAQVESRLGRQFPPQLREFYLRVGNGGAGPDYGLRPADKVTADLAGSLCIADQGCGHETHVVTDAARLGAMRFVSDGGDVHESDMTLVEFYLRWLDAEIDAFRAVSALIEAGKSMQQIDAGLSATHERHDGRDIAVSLLDVPKPESLFGSRQARIYHGAVQFPWYDEQLRRHRGEPTPAQPVAVALVHATTASQATALPARARPWWRFW